VISLNVGVRYLLPVILLLYLFIARIAAGPLRSGMLRLAVIGMLLLVNIAITLRAFPNYISYFNLVSGGSANGYRILVDSNLDWGQDLPALADYLRETDADTVYLSYFGQAEPAYYGIDYTPLPGWPPPTPDPSRPAFAPLNPAPGLYAISASNLVGVQLYQPETFGYFRAREPLARINNSIFIYDVPDTVEAADVWVGQCADTPVEAEEYLPELVGKASIDTLYFDCNTSLSSFRQPGWVMLPAGREPVGLDRPADFLSRNADGSPKYGAWRVVEAPPAPPSTVEFPAVPLPVPVAGYIEMLGYQLSAPDAAPGDTLTLTVWWSVREVPPPPVSLFAHILGGDGSLLVAGDALGVAIEDWEPGMVLIQQHQFVLPEATPPGLYAVTTGLYSLGTGERFPIARSGDRVVDRIALKSIQIGVEATPEP
ncbi:MAG: hypothetical protein IT326_00270, partial [Anaerolineae bacterium]|nr:hypothetical protein [Anaerolineae bacterium]